MPPKVLLLRSLPPQGQSVLQSAAAADVITLIEWTRDSGADRAWVLTELRKGGVEGVICMLNDKIDEEFIEAAGLSLKVISTMSAGFDHIDVAACAKRGIRLGTTPDALTDATADVGAMLVLMASRNAGEGVRAVVEGKWPSLPWSPLLLCGHALKNATVGILGFGKIGQLTLKRLLGFGIARALYTTSTPGVALHAAKDHFNLLTTSSVPILPAASLDDLAAQSDFLVICCALTPATYHLVNATFLSKMKSTAYVVNTARGGIVDSLALVAAIEAGRLAGAGLDVVEGEPGIGADHPAVRCRKIVVLPHVGSATFEARGEMARQAVANLLAGLGVHGVEWENEVRI